MGLVLKNIPYYQAAMWLDYADSDSDINAEMEYRELRSGYVAQRWTREMCDIVLKQFLSVETKESYSIDFESYGGQINRYAVHICTHTHSLSVNQQPT